MEAHVGLHPAESDRREQPGKRVGRPRRGSTRRSNITGRPWKTSPTTRRPTTTSAWRWPAAGRSTRRSTITEGPWISIPTAWRPTTTSLWRWPAAARFEEAIAHYRQALALATARNNRALAVAIRAQIRHCQSLAPAGKGPYAGGVAETSDSEKKASRGVYPCGCRVLREIAAEERRPTAGINPAARFSGALLFSAVGFLPLALAPATWYDRSSPLPCSCCRCNLLVSRYVCPLGA